MWTVIVNRSIKCCCKIEPEREIDSDIKVMFHGLSYTYHGNMYGYTMGYEFMNAKLTKL